MADALGSVCLIFTFIPKQLSTISVDIEMACYYAPMSLEMEKIVSSYYCWIHMNPERKIYGYIISYI
jgi:hypothetical protein